MKKQKIAEKLDLKKMKLQKWKKRYNFSAR